MSLCQIFSAWGPAEGALDHLFDHEIFLEAIEVVQFLKPIVAIHHNLGVVIHRLEAYVTVLLFRNLKFKFLNLVKKFINLSIDLFLLLRKFWLFNIAHGIHSLCLNIPENAVKHLFEEVGKDKLGQNTQNYPAAPLGDLKDS